MNAADIDEVAQEIATAHAFPLAVGMFIMVAGSLIAATAYLGWIGFGAVIGLYGAVYTLTAIRRAKSATRAKIARRLAAEKGGAS